MTPDDPRIPKPKAETKPGMNGLELWEKVEKTDPAHTKEYQGKGGFKGTAIKPIYLIKKATELWGPMGHKWGAKVLSEVVHDGAPMMLNGQVCGIEKLHSVRIVLWYTTDEGVAQVESYGHTLMVGSNRNGFFTDDEAPKKSFTDAIGKALHYLGFSADIYFGEFDGSKYDKQKQEEKPVPEDLKEKLTKSIANATEGKAIEDKIASLTEKDTNGAMEALKQIMALPDGAAKEKRKKLLSDKVKALGWAVAKDASGAVTISAPLGIKEP